LHEVHDAADVIYNAVDPSANIIFGAVVDENLKDEILITVIATGFHLTPSKNVIPRRAAVAQPVSFSKKEINEPEFSTFKSARAEEPVRELVEEPVAAAPVSKVFGEDDIPPQDDAVFEFSPKVIDLP